MSLTSVRSNCILLCSVYHPYLFAAISSLLSTISFTSILLLSTSHYHHSERSLLFSSPLLSIVVNYSAHHSSTLFVFLILYGFSRPLNTFYLPHSSCSEHGSAAEHSRVYGPSLPAAQTVQPRTGRTKSIQSTSCLSRVVLNNRN